ncbi:MAG TPA: trypsin-like serine protease [Kofleriaceae bacterium]|nr:trypsin-like serine protease [Kofleriaceae bacterium]
MRIPRTPRLLALALVALVAAACGPSVGPGGNSREIGGSYPISIEEAPWQVSVQDSSGAHLCSGSILTDTFILTAQHCAGAEATGLSVLAGVDRLSDPGSGQRREVIKVIPFPGYTDARLGKDVSLLRLTEPLDLDGRRVEPIAIADGRATSLGLTDPGVMGTANGWGALSQSGPSSDDLEAIDRPLVSSEDARPAIELDLTEDQLPVGYLDGEDVDSCRLDGGASLVVPDEEGTGALLAGLASWSDGCDVPGAPGIYARASSYTEFIAEFVVDEPPPPPPPPPPEGVLFINEVLADPGTGNDYNGDGVASTTDDEFVELINVGDGELDLSGATVADDFGPRGALPDGTVLEPGAVLVIFGGGTPTGFEVQTAAFQLGLNNDGDSVTITSADGGVVLAAMSYAAEGGQDQSMVRQTDGEESPFVLHTTLSALLASPGLRSDGTPF